MILRPLLVAILILAAGILLGGLLLAALLPEPVCIKASAHCVSVVGT